MCDCYEHQCEECLSTIPWHIADYNYPREAFRLWCVAHAPNAPANAGRFDIDGETIAVIGPELGDKNMPNCRGVVVFSPGNGAAE